MTIGITDSMFKDHPSIGGLMHPRIAPILALIALLTAACASPAASEPEPTEAATATAAEATAEPTATESEAPGELTLPDDVTLSWIGDFQPVTGTARFNQLTEDQVAISIDVEAGEDAAATGFAVLLLRGTCTDQTEPADFQGALDVQNFDLGETPAFLVSRDELADIVATPHSILVTDGPGLSNLACGDISS